MTPFIGLLAKDSVKVAQLERIYAASRDDSSLAVNAITAMRQLDSDVAWRAVWLLKRMARENKLTEVDLIRVASCVDEMPHWAARLNLCQLFATTGCPPAVHESLYPYLVECFGDRRVIVRAWAISALTTFRGDGIYRKTVDAMLRAARAESGKSMKARLRQLPQYDRQPARADARDHDSRR